MSNPYRLPPPVSTKPKRRFFDAWNSSSTGHQKADNSLAGSTGWRESRSLKLSNQFGAGASGGARLADTVGAGSENFGKDGRLANGSWTKGAPGLRNRSQISVVEAFRVKKVGVKDTAIEKVKAKVVVDGVKEQELDLLDIPSAQPVRETSSQDQEQASSYEDQLLREISSPDEQEGKTHQEQETETATSLKPPQVFVGTCIYINGSTYPTISDHKLKHLLVTHGARLSIHLGRRSVTHVILGRPNASTVPGAGGGLSASKMQKEITKIGGKNVKFVTVEWVMESVANRKRAPEQRFEAVRLALKGTGRVEQMFAKAAKKG
ncbi:hypothetical protein D6D19_06588 [Aureobasidium pullulans]|uniref:BRCT domain-containing protein n=1 Tax=Aureobasidium pullulans TaxID=5580 RepID=A0A4S9A0D5_AURPU|nr:hypothetical protein D6D19_06588 [Aureobasidium pullulans]